MKKDHTGLLICICTLAVAVILGANQYSINKTATYVATVESAEISVAEDLQALSSKQSQDISTLQSEVNALREVNESQNEIIAQQKDVIDTYDQKFEDLHKEVDAYTEVLEKEAPKFQLPTTWKGAKTTKQNGGVMGPSGRETYYNLNMKNCVANMRKRGYDEKRYPVWERDDGAKMFGHYVMIAANWKIRPLGTVVETSIGWGIVVDTGEFVKDYPRGIDLAVNW